MTAQTGRTVSKFTRFVLADSTNTMREIPIDSINGVGLTYSEKDLTAFQDALHGVLPETPDAAVTITGPFDNSAAQAMAASGLAPTLSGSHTVLSGLVGGMTPRSLGILIGMRQYYTTGEPAWTVVASATSGFICTGYDVNPNDGKYTAKFRMFPGSSAPAWNNAIPTAS